jgi:hypothetical protein
LDHRGGSEAPPSEAHVLGAWAIANLSYARGRLAERAQVADLESAPATLVFDLIYCLLLDETKERNERREEFDAQLASYVQPIEVGDRSHRDQLAATWGKLPAHQRAMRRAIDAGGSGNRVGK